MDGTALGHTLLLAVTNYVRRSLDPHRRQIDVLGKKGRQLATRQDSTEQLIADLEARVAALEKRERDAPQLRKVGG